MSEPTAGGRCQFAEPQGGCIVPRRYDPKRGSAIVGQSATWHGEVFIPRKKSDPEWIARALVIARRWRDEAPGD